MDNNIENHPIKEHCQKNKIQLKEFAKAIGISMAYTSGIIHGKSIPSLILAYHIQEKTMGCITMQDMARWHEMHHKGRYHDTTGDTCL